MATRGRPGIEILLTGDELLDGSVVDANGAWLAEKIFSLGGEVQRVTVIGDDLPRIAATLREACGRARLVVVSGGLGPTQDDHSVDAACLAFDDEAVVDAGELARIRSLFERRGREFTPNNERQARVPSRARVLGNDFGTATAFVCTEGEAPCELWFLPGVPSEFRGLVEQKLLPHLARQLAGEKRARCVRVIKAFGLAESHVDHRIRPLLARHPGVRYGIRNQLMENHVRLVAEAPSDAEAEARCEELAQAVRQALGPAAFGSAEDSLASVTVEALRGRSLRVAFAESLTAGLAASLLAETPGASEILLGSSVVYDEGLKEGWLGVPASVLEEEGPVSAACAAAMAEGALARSGADLAVALTGWAGPTGGSERDPTGTVYLALADREEATQVLRQVLPFGRNALRRAAASLGIDLLRRRALRLPLP